MRRSPGVTAPRICWTVCVMKSGAILLAVQLSENCADHLTTALLALMLRVVSRLLLMLTYGTEGSFAARKETTAS